MWLVVFRCCGEDHGGCQNEKKKTILKRIGVRLENDFCCVFALRGSFVRKSLVAPRIAVYENKKGGAGYVQELDDVRLRCAPETLLVGFK